MVVVKIIGILLAIIVMAGFILFAGLVCFLVLEKYGDLDDEDIYHDDIQD
jgi:hypothetical protein